MESHEEMQSLAYSGKKGFGFLTMPGNLTDPWPRLSRPSLDVCLNPLIYGAVTGRVVVLLAVPFCVMTRFKLPAGLLSGTVKMIW